MSEFKKYRRTNVAEMKVAEPSDFTEPNIISVAEVDRDEVSKLLHTGEDGGMIARNPGNHNDQWYVAKKYFEENFEPMEEE